MGLFEYIVIYIISWWLILLMILPYKSQVPVQSGPNEYHAAPARAYLKVKLLVTSGLALLATAVVSYAIQGGYIEQWFPYQL